MKNITLRTAIVIATVSFACAGCSQLLIKTEQNKTVLINGLNVKLKGNLTLGELSRNDDQIFSELSKARNSTYARSVLGTEEELLSGINDEKLNLIINSVIDEYDFPIFSNEGSVDFDAIKADFPGLDENDILKNYEQILNIYNQELGSLSLYETINMLTNSSSGSKGLYDYSIEYDTSSITLYEIVACVKHPFSAVKLSSTRQNAFDLEQRAYGSSGNGDNQADAFRHCAWNILLARYGVGLKGEKLLWANDFATAHEKGSKYVPYTSEMDLHNNQVGRTVYDDETYRSYTKVLWWKIETGVTNEPSDDRIYAVLKPKADVAIIVPETLGLATVQATINNASAYTLVCLKL